MKLAFIELVAMGYPMVGHLTRAFPTLVWNINSDKAQNQAREFGSEAALSITAY